jgi:hypothetical protein
MDYQEEIHLLAKEVLILMEKNGGRFDMAFHTLLPNSGLTRYDWHTVRSGVKRLHRCWKVEKIRIAGAWGAARQAKEHIAPLH